MKTDQVKILTIVWRVILKIDSLGFIISIRDCKLYSKGIKPNRHWRISDVKTYFGLKGDASKLVVQLEDIKSALTNS